MSSSFKANIGWPLLMIWLLLHTTLFAGISQACDEHDEDLVLVEDVRLCGSFRAVGDGSLTDRRNVLERKPIDELPAYLTRHAEAYHENLLGSAEEATAPPIPDAAPPSFYMSPHTNTHQRRPNDSALLNPLAGKDPLGDLLEKKGWYIKNDGEGNAAAESAPAAPPGAISEPAGADNSATAAKLSSTNLYGPNFFSLGRAQTRGCHSAPEEASASGGTIEGDDQLKRLPDDSALLNPLAGKRPLLDIVGKKGRYIKNDGEGNAAAESAPAAPPGAISEPAGADNSATAAKLSSINLYGPNFFSLGRAPTRDCHSAPEEASASSGTIEGDDQLKRLPNESALLNPLAEKGPLMIAKLSGKRPYVDFLRGESRHIKDEGEENRYNGRPRGCSSSGRHAGGDDAKTILCKLRESLARKQRHMENDGKGNYYNGRPCGNSSSCHGGGGGGAEALLSKLRDSVARTQQHIKNDGEGSCDDGTAADTLGPLLETLKDLRFL